MHFVSAYKKVGTFTKNGANKNGGNVATYFCLPDETVVHVIPGPVNADVFLREARWAVDVYESAVMEHRDDIEGQKDYLKRAHAVRFLKDHRGITPTPRKGVDLDARIKSLMPKSMPQGVGTIVQAHWLLWSNPAPRLATIYRTVWTNILDEEVTDLPVLGR
jgi:hypothetical protein